MTKLICFLHGFHFGKFSDHYVTIVHRLYTFLNYHRPKYAHVAELHCHFPGVPIAALTATATPLVQAKLHSLLTKPVTEIASVNKPNVSYIVRLLQPLPKGSVIDNHILVSPALLFMYAQVLLLMMTMSTSLHTLLTMCYHTFNNEEQLSTLMLLRMYLG